jgi:hypothetical protein
MQAHIRLKNKIANLGYLNVEFDFFQIHTGQKPKKQYSYQAIEHPIGESSVVHTKSTTLKLSNGPINRNTQGSLIAYDVSLSNEDVKLSLHRFQAPASSQYHLRYLLWTL